MTEQEIISESALRKRLLTRIVKHRSEETLCIAADALSDLLCDADDEMTHDLLEPIFEYSDYWPGQLAKQVLGLDDDQEYTCDELLAESERRELEEKEDEEASDAWVKEGF
ncbi:hypothetical protein [Rubinisphaera brasiliensis]|uniref:Uncharacterized protein n=1 Tax=Rubinisphaera brasiliensis (strain ATCC 49424 / DSM 5305 / JCM 21570 / IAM 15109 / NBRC 103401 / IFAM 1448) TaxID=756272 RepID=F0SKS4_RUBBR|nr:hypothetical protein [Rubinisphaera brasiliensis]ADY58744.1 hypothetical protein Plabr_1128 [Rubinisphaera brasiliensis DSM 5305]